MTNYPKKKIKCICEVSDFQKWVFLEHTLCRRWTMQKKKKESNFLISDFMRSFKMKLIKLL